MNIAFWKKKMKPSKKNEKPFYTLKSVQINTWRATLGGFTSVENVKIFFSICSSGEQIGRNKVYLLVTTDV